MNLMCETYKADSNNSYDTAMNWISLALFCALYFTIFALYLWKGLTISR